MYTFTSFDFFQLTYVFINRTTFCTPSDPINILVSEKTLKRKNSVTGLYLLDFGIYHTDCYHPDCFHCYVRHMFAPF